MTEENNISRQRGRPPKISRELAKEPIRETVRESVRPNKKEVIGRNGKSLSRKRGGNVDRFYIPPNLIPEGWSYEWKREVTYGQEDTAHMMHMAENGWTPVPASAHPGYFMKDGHEGPIRRDGMILMERPIELTQEARREDEINAKNLMQAQKEQLGLSLPTGFSDQHRGVQPRIKQSYEPSDIGRPRLAIDET